MAYNLTPRYQFKLELVKPDGTLAIGTLDSPSAYLTRTKIESLIPEGYSLLTWWRTD